MHNPDTWNYFQDTFCLCKKCINRHVRFRNCGTVHCKKELAIFPSPAGMSLTKLSLAGKKLNYSRPGRVWSVTSRLGTGKRLTIFYSVAKFTVPDCGDKVDSGIGLSYRPARLYTWAPWKHWALSTTGWKRWALPTSAWQHWASAHQCMDRCVTGYIYLDGYSATHYCTVYILDLEGLVAGCTYLYGSSATHYCTALPGRVYYRRLVLHDGLRMRRCPPLPTFEI